MPSNTPGTATALSPPTVITEIISSGDERWFRYTPEAGETALGFWAYGDALAFGCEVSVYKGADPGSLSNLVGGTNPWFSDDKIPIQCAIEPGFDLYFKVVPQDDGILKVSPVLGPADGWEPGCILINDDSVGLPMAVLDPETGLTRQIVHPICAGEGGDALETGLVAFHDFDSDTVRVYDAGAGFAEIANLTPTGVGERLIRTNRSLDRAYVLSHDTGTVRVQFIDNTGALDGTVRTGTRSGTVTGLATSPTGLLGYYAQSGGAVRVLSLNDGAGNLADLIAAPGDGSLSWDILVRTNGDLLVCRYRYGLTGVKVHRYADNGIEIEVHDFGDLWHGPGGGTPPRLAYDGAQPSTYYWIMLHNDTPDGYTTIYKVAVIGGAIVTTIERPEFEGGVWMPAPTLTPVERFGNSFSCPLVVLASGEGGPDPDPDPDPDPLPPGSIGPIVWVMWPREVP